jgi:hypothetical protein
MLRYGAVLPGCTMGEAGLLTTDGHNVFALLVPRAKHYPREVLHLHALGLPSLKNRLLNIRRQQCQPQQPIDEAPSDALSASTISVADL